MTLVDRIIGGFASEEVQKRARWIAALGLILCIAAVAGGATLLQREHEVAMAGTAQWQDATGRLLEAAFDPASLRLIPLGAPLAVECVAPGEAPFRSPVEVREIDPDAGRVELLAPGIPDQLKAAGRFDIRLILARGPYWNFLWGRPR